MYRKNIFIPFVEVDTDYLRYIDWELEDEISEANDSSDGQSDHLEEQLKLGHSDGEKQSGTEIILAKSQNLSITSMEEMKIRNDN